MLTTLITEDEGAFFLITETFGNYRESIEETLGKHASIKFVKELGHVWQLTGLCDRRRVILLQCGSGQK